MRLNVTSEIGRLKSVLVHLPGREIDVMVPPMMAQLLFDDILFGQVAREEHRRFQQLMRFVAKDLFDVQDLLEEIFDDEEVKREIVRDFAKRSNLSRRLTASLGEERPSALAEVLIGGIPREKQDSGGLPRFDLAPIPNYFFTRDPKWSSDRASWCAAWPPAREGAKRCCRNTSSNITRRFVTPVSSKSISWRATVNARDAKTRRRWKVATFWSRARIS